MKRCLDLAANRRKAAFPFVGFILRMAIFGGVFYAALRFGGYEAGAGCAIAFLAPYAGVSFSPYLEKLAERLTGASPGAKMPAESASSRRYEDCLRDASGRRRYVLIRTHDMIRYSSGRRYVTHRSFRKLRPAGAMDAPEEEAETHA
jgi:hypothetical protein